MQKNPKLILGLYTQTKNLDLVDAQKFKTKRGEKRRLSGGYRHTRIPTHTYKTKISAVLETSSVFNMQVSVTDANIFSVNLKELRGQKLPQVIVRQDLR